MADWGNPKNLRFLAFRGNRRVSPLSCPFNSLSSVSQRPFSPWGCDPCAFYPLLRNKFPQSVVASIVSLSYLSKFPHVRNSDWVWLKLSHEWDGCPSVGRSPQVLVTWACPCEACSSVLTTWQLASPERVIQESEEGRSLYLLWPFLWVTRQDFCHILFILSVTKSSPPSKGGELGSTS